MYTYTCPYTCAVPAPTHLHPYRHEHIHIPMYTWICWYRTQTEFIWRFKYQVICLRYYSVSHLLLIFYIMKWEASGIWCKDTISMSPQEFSCIPSKSAYFLKIIDFPIFFVTAHWSCGERQVCGVIWQAFLCFSFCSHHMSLRFTQVLMGLTVQHCHY